MDIRKLRFRFLSIFLAFVILCFGFFAPKNSDFSIIKSDEANAELVLGTVTLACLLFASATITAGVVYNNSEEIISAYEKFSKTTSFPKWLDNMKTYYDASVFFAKAYTKSQLEKILKSGKGYRAKNLSGKAIANTVESIYTSNVANLPRSFDINDYTSVPNRVALNFYNCPVELEIDNFVRKNTIVDGTEVSGSPYHMSEWTIYNTTLNSSDISFSSPYTMENTLGAKSVETFIAPLMLQHRILSGDYGLLKRSYIPSSCLSSSGIVNCSDVFSNVSSILSSLVGFDGSYLVDNGFYRLDSSVSSQQSHYISEILTSVKPIGLRNYRLSDNALINEIILVATYKVINRVGHISDITQELSYYVYDVSRPENADFGVGQIAKVVSHPISGEDILVTPTNSINRSGIRDISSSNISSHIFDDNITFNDNSPFSLDYSSPKTIELYSNTFSYPDVVSSIHPVSNIDTALNIPVGEVGSLSDLDNVVSRDYFDKYVNDLISSTPISYPNNLDYSHTIPDYTPSVVVPDVVVPPYTLPNDVPRERVGDIVVSSPISYPVDTPIDTPIDYPIVSDSEFQFDPDDKVDYENPLPKEAVYFGILGKILSALIRLYNALKSVPLILSDIWNKIKNLSFTATLNSILSKISSILTAIEVKANNFIDDIVKALSKSLIVSKLALLVDYLAKIWEKIRTWVVSGVTSVTSVFDPSSVIENIKAIPTTIINTITNVIDTIISLPNLIVEKIKFVLDYLFVPDFDVIQKKYDLLSNKFKSKFDFLNKPISFVKNIYSSPKSIHDLSINVYGNEIYIFPLVLATPLSIFRTISSGVCILLTFIWLYKRFMPEKVTD